ncbi:TetR/AcrR family transcriptional regulator [Maritimibacter sp. 55A14]|uniref:TetR/AcrR family transcriptional regulator n=1 Tax=Maritimibacter sp. 55A14 TaxID=2174844 RepID=UPI000D613D1E|nr:TetR/AcrR family transcriptional regulator [Maritimibacter sp. 55A14]PWE33234.1 TetR/AcrR family transcriptional regulator [Maritimibacter sp. 55A14]
MQPGAAPRSAANADHSYAAGIEAGLGRLRRGARTRAALHLAACRLLDAAPPEDLTVAAICGGAGVAHGTFYIYFADRQALLGELLDGFAGFAKAVMRAAARAVDADPVEGPTAAYMALFEANPGLMRCLIGHPDGFSEAREAFQRLNRDWVMTVVRAVERQAAREGRQAAPRAELMRRAYALGGMVDQYMAGLVLSGDPTLAEISADRDAVIATLSLIWRRGMEA